MRISHEIFHKPPAFIPLAARSCERIESLFAAVHESAHGPTRTSHDVRISVAIRCEADIERTEFS